MPIDALVMVPYDLSDLFVVVDVRENSLANRGVLLHLVSFLKCQRSWLFEKTSGQAHFADVVYEAA